MSHDEKTCGFNCKDEPVPMTSGASMAAFDERRPSEAPVTLEEEQAYLRGQGPDPFKATEKCDACGKDVPRESYRRMPGGREGRCVECSERGVPYGAYLRSSEALPEAKRVECWRIRPVEGGAWLYDLSLTSLVDLIEAETSENHAFVLEKTSMTEEEAANMGEFDGW